MASRRARGLKIVQFALVQLAKAVADGRVRISLADWAKLIHLEEFLSDDPDGREDLKFLAEVRFGRCGGDDGPSRLEF